MQVVELTSPYKEFDYSRFHTGRSACVVRYGAFGDMLQASSVFPALKEKGYRLTVNTTEKGFDIIKNDPHVDSVLVQKTDQVPNAELFEFWELLRKPFNFFANLSESVERSLLAIPEDRSYMWHKAFRDLVMSVDYLDATHAIAEVPDAPRRPKFYPTKSERVEAEKCRVKLGPKNKVILWCLSGSSVHKSWPYTDQVVARLMIQRPDVRVVFVGDALCQILDSAWVNEPRVKRKCGKWSIRETLSFAPLADLVIGPETGVMNAVSYEDVPKVLMLSHSSPMNLGGNWLNTSAMVPKETPCWPCHKLHFMWATCNRDEETGGAKCAANISADEVYRAILEAI